MALLAALLAASGCSPRTDTPKPELLVLCGITMIHPMEELARQFEVGTGCTVLLIKGGSGDLLAAAKNGGRTDLFLPGEASYVTEAAAGGLVAEQSNVGCNHIVLVVPHGNPGGLSADLTRLPAPGRRVALASPDSGSIGRAARRALEKAGALEAVLHEGLHQYANDSKGITEAVLRGEADVGINWHAATADAEAAGQVAILALDPGVAPPEPLVLARLTGSGQPALASHFIAFAASPAGRAVFERHGFACGAGAGAQP